MEQGSICLSTSNGYGNYTLQPKCKVFLSHSGAQKGFVEQLCVDLERFSRHTFFDKRRDCLPIGKDFPSLIFGAIEQCEVGVVVLSKDFFTSKWPMLEFVAMANVKRKKPSFTIMPIFLNITFSQCCDVNNHKRWLSLWQSWAECDSRIDVKDWEKALHLLGPTTGLKYNFELGEVKFREEIVEAVCKLVPPRTRFEDFHVQERCRLCKVIHEIKFLLVSLLYGMHVLGIALFFDGLAFGLACGALAKLRKGTPQYFAPGFLACGYTEGSATRLAAWAIVFLLIGQVVITVATSCISCGEVTYKSGFGRVCAVLLLIFSWLSFTIAEVFLLTGAILNNTRIIGQFDEGVYSVDDAFCKNVQEAIFAVGVAFSFLAILSSLVYYVIQAGARTKEQQWASYRGEADPYSEHDGPTIGMTAYN